MRLRIHIKHYNDLILFMLLFLNGSFVVANNIISSNATILLWLSTAFLIVYKLRCVRYSKLLFLFVMLLSLWLSTILNGEEIRISILVTVSFAIVMLYSDLVPFEQFRESYVRVLYVLSVVSLIGFSCYQIFPSLKKTFLVRNAAGYYASNWWVFVQLLGSSRNQGMYWEPGAFQTFVNLALLFELQKENGDWKKIVIFVVTVLSAYSTTGFLGMGLIILCTIFRYKGQRKSKLLTVGLVLLIAGFVILNSDVLFSTNNNSVFGKILRFFRDREYESGKHNSATIRYFSVVKVMQAFFESPVWGLGYHGLNETLYQYTRNMNTCTFANWYAVYGMAYGIIMTGGMYGLARRLAPTKTQILIILGVLFVLTISENYVHNAVITMLAFYGLEKSEKNEISVNK